ncbi:TPA: YopX family protein, partial [Campylobacter coli]
MKLSDFDFRVWDGRKYVNNIKGGVYIHKDTDVKCLNRNQDCYNYEFQLDDLDNSNLEIELFTGLYDKK